MQKNKTKIIFITSGLGVGGAEKQLAMLAKGLIDREFDVLVISMSKWEESTIHPDFDGLRLIQFNLKPRLGVLVSFLGFLNAIRVENPHIIQGWMYAGISLRLLLVRFLVHEFIIQYERPIWIAIDMVGRFG